MTQYLDDPFIWNFLGIVSPSHLAWTDINKVQTKTGDMLFRFSFSGIDWSKPLSSYLWVRLSFLTSEPPYYVSPVSRIYVSENPIIVNFQPAKWFDPSLKDLRFEVQKKFFRRTRRHGWWPDQNWQVSVHQLVA
jgi:hypothetical protein